LLAVGGERQQKEAEDGEDLRVHDFVGLVIVNIISKAGIS
jgi:hypothetical protein